jgi:uncharacterized protein YcbX
LLGESATRLSLDRRGVVGDRVWSIRTADGKIGSGKNTRRFATVPGLLALRAVERDGRVSITLPDGSIYPTNADDVAGALSRLLGQPVTLALETDVSHFDDGPVSLIGSASVAAVVREYGEHIDPTRFRSNIVLRTVEPFVEEQWIGRHVQIGGATLLISMASPRCVMVNEATADLPPQHGVLAAVGRVNQARLGVVADVLVPGVITTGDFLKVTSPQRG